MGVCSGGVVGGCAGGLVGGCAGGLVGGCAGGLKGGAAGRLAGVGAKGADGQEPQYGRLVEFKAESLAKPKGSERMFGRHQDLRS
jgi:hypothetical protein